MQHFYPMFSINGVLVKRRMIGRMTQLALCAVALGCANPVPRTGQTRFGAAPQAIPIVPLTDAQIAGVTVSINGGEIETGQTALQHGSDSSVRDFATRMVSEHAATLQQGQQLFTQLGIAPEATSFSAQVDTEAQQVMQQLNVAASGQIAPSGPVCATPAALDCVYMQSQVQMHQSALQLLSQTLIPRAQSPQMVQYLGAMRNMEADHLATATVQAATGATGTP
jgi:putative membrane protein